MYIHTISILFRTKIVLFACILFSKLTFAQTNESPYSPYISYSDFNAVTPSEKSLLDLQELYSRMLIAREDYREMNQVRWNDVFIDMSELEKALEETEEKIFRLQAHVHSITYAEHDGTPTDFEFLSLLEEIKVFVLLKNEFDGMLTQRDRLYEITTSEVQENLQLKLELRKLSSRIPQIQKDLEWRARIIKNKIDRYAAHSHLDPRNLSPIELAKASYNLHVIMEMALESQKLMPARSLFSRLFQPAPTPEFIPAISPHLLDLFYLEFNSNNPKSPILNPASRIKEFEDQLLRIRGEKYVTQEMKFTPQNGYQEAAYFFARLRDTSVDSKIYDVLERDSLADYKDLILGNDSTAFTLAACSKYFTK